jgi:hypothetical protein
MSTRIFEEMADQFFVVDVAVVFLYVAESVPIILPWTDHISSWKYASSSWKLLQQQEYLRVRAIIETEPIKW